MLTLTHEIQTSDTLVPTSYGLDANDEIPASLPQLAYGLGVDRLWGDKADCFEVSGFGMQLPKRMEENECAREV